jgi:hypothetical protein
MIGKARNAKHIKTLVWRETSMIEVHSAIIGLFGNELWSRRWSIASFTPQMPRPCNHSFCKP